MGGLGVCYKCYTFLASLDINQPPNFTKVAPIFYMILNKSGTTRMGYVIYITRGNLTILLYTFFRGLSSHLRNKVKNFTKA